LKTKSKKRAAKKPFEKTKTIAITVAGTLLLGAFGSGLWDLVFKPGIGSVGQLALELFSYMDKAVFASAALDPQPISGLIFLLLALNIPYTFGLVFIFRGFIRFRLNQHLDQKFKPRAHEHKLEAQTRSHRFVQVVAGTCAVVCLAVFILGYLLFSVVNKATLVWRTFHCNLEICAPHITQSVVAETRAKFRSMKSRTDFNNIQTFLNDVAYKHGITLEWNGISKPTKR